jgi:hypothetical protein
MKTLGELFDVRNGNSLELNRLRTTTPDRGVAFVSRKMGDNGIAAYVERIPEVEPNPGGELTCALSGNGVLTTCIQDRPYYTAFHVACLRPKVKMSTAQLLYYCACVQANRFKYSWGRQANRDFKSILLPNPSEIPTWVDAVETDPYAGKDVPRSNEPARAIDVSHWKPFRLSALFDIKKGQRLTKINMKPGKTPFIGSIDNNNGVSGFVGQEPIHDGNTITVNYNGSVAEAFYQPHKFWASDDVNVLYPKFELTPAIAMFLITVIRQERYRFTFGRKWHLERMRASEIKLPVCKDGRPDWAFMERYINSLPFSSQL